MKKNTHLNKDKNCVLLVIFTLFASLLISSGQHASESAKLGIMYSALGNVMKIVSLYHSEFLNQIFNNHLAHLNQRIK